MFRSSTIADFVDSVPFVEYYSPFWGPKAISLSNPRVYLRVGRQDSQFGPFWPISLTITQFWVPNVISTIDEPRGAFTYRLPTLTILANSRPFRGLLLTGLGSLSDFHD